MWASVEGFLEVVKLLLEKGADVTQKDNNFNRTALQWAMSNNHYEIANILRQVV